MSQILNKSTQMILFAGALFLCSCTTLALKEFMDEAREAYPDDNPLEEFVEYRILQATGLDIDLTPGSPELTEQEKDIKRLLEKTETMVEQKEYLENLNKKLQALDKKLKAHDLIDANTSIFKESDIAVGSDDLNHQYRF